MEQVLNIPDIDDLSISFLKNFKRSMKPVPIVETVTDSTINDIDDIDENICSKCASHNIIQADGFFTCRDCGLLNSVVIDSGQEWRYYGADDNKGNDPSRCGFPTSDLLPETSIGSMMGMRPHESFKMKKLRNMQSWSSISYQDNTLLSSFNNINAIAINAGISQYIVEEAKHMYKKVYLMKTSKIKLEAMQAASVQWACKIKGVPRDTVELATLFNIKVKDMRRGSKLFEEVWNSIVIGELDIIKEDESKPDQTEQQNKDSIKASIELEESSLKPSNAMDYLHRSCSKLELSEEIYQICKSLCSYTEDNDLLIKHIPVSRTAGCIYFTCIQLKIPLSFVDISQICDISDVTIKKCYQKINKFKDELIENTLLKKYVNV
jgi:transcription initiation factor TFIIIB Brf1 subunit/transcription initiation factor TFIIB